MSVGILLQHLTEQLKGRLPAEVVEQAELYNAMNEWGVAFDLLCQQLYEFDIKISRHEWDQLNNARQLLELNQYDLEELQHLIE